MPCSPGTYFICTIRDYTCIQTTYSEQSIIQRCRMDGKRQKNSVSTYWSQVINLSNSKLECNAPLTSVHDQISSHFWLPVVPGGLEALCKADAEILEVAFAHQGLGRAGGDQRALDGQDQGWAGIKVYAVVGLVEGGGRGRGLHRLRAMLKNMEKRTHFHVFGKGTFSW